MVAKSIVPVSCIFVLLGALLSPAAAHRRLLQASGSTTDTGDLFVMTAMTATLTMSGEKGSLQMDGLRPHTIWFADKPARTGGQLDTSEFLGKEFIQNGNWISNPNVALYSSNTNASDTVVSLAIMSNPQMINDTSVIFPVVSTIVNSSQKPSSVASYYQVQGAGRNDGPTFLSMSAADANVTTLTSVAMFVDPYYCGCGCYGFCGCGWHVTSCLSG